MNDVNGTYIINATLASSQAQFINYGQVFFRGEEAIFYGTFEHEGLMDIEYGSGTRLIIRLDMTLFYNNNSN